MRSIQARFNKQEKLTPSAGAYINLQRAVRGQRFLHDSIVKAFRELVPVSDYAKSERGGLIEWLEIQTNKPRKR